MSPKAFSSSAAGFLSSNTVLKTNECVLFIAPLCVLLAKAFKRYALYFVADGSTRGFLVSLGSDLDP